MFAENLNGKQHEESTNEAPLQIIDMSGEIYLWNTVKDNVDVSDAVYSHPQFQISYYNWI